MKVKNTYFLQLSFFKKACCLIRFFELLIYNMFIVRLLRVLTGGASIALFFVMLVFPAGGEGAVVLENPFPKIRVLTETYPPYSYVDSGKVVGLSTEVVRAVLEKLKIDAEIEIKDWDDAYSEAQNEANVLIYSIVQKKDRYNDFHWVGIVAPTSYEGFIGLVKNQAKIKLQTLADLKRYKVGTVTNDSKESFLIQNGFEIDKTLISYPSQEEAIKRLYAGQVDLVIMPTIVANFFSTMQHQDPGQLHMYFAVPLLQDASYFMAFGHKTSPEVAEKFKKALAEVKESGLYDSIVKKYMVTLH
ncbi:MAG: hypothetical protein A2007_04685 [Verrucomicrobia bacterium GWC2_42_7]|nr:MAG: hypothetical protein A2007_04685 [Verrucomicrobia bacterium GWC2_42_7]